VASRVGGTPEVVEHALTGLLVPAANAEALATAMLALLNDEALAERMGRAARSRAEHEFTVGRMTASYEALYEEAVIGRMRIQAA
jgi:glycosyltransferase involved in cell wall biosynthesis